MLSKAQIKYVNALKIKKYRQQYQAFIAEGPKIARELLRSSIELEGVYALESWIRGHRDSLRAIEAIVTPVSEAELKKISALTTPNEVLVCARIPRPEANHQAVLNREMAVALDNIRDPGNMGTILRTADWFGLEYIFCSPDCADVWNHKVVQASMGSICRAKVFYEPLANLFEAHSDIPVYGAMLAGASIFEQQFGRTGMLLIGNESAGISPELHPYITHPLTIPGKGGAESLNAAVAAGILCAIARNQQ